MTLTTRILQAITGLAGLGALILGLLDWIVNINLIPIHMLLGLTVTLGLLILSILMMFNKGMRIWGVVGIIYALIIPTFGLNQMTMLVGDYHWVIRTAHMLVGIGAMALAGIMGNQYLRLQAQRQAVAQ